MSVARENVHITKEIDCIYFVFIIGFTELETGNDWD